jgi:hypothetical protein
VSQVPQNKTGKINVYVKYTEVKIGPKNYKSPKKKKKINKLISN